MKKAFIALILIVSVFISGGALFAFDIGGSLSSSTSFSTASNGGIVNEEALGLWLESGQGEDYSFEAKLDLLFSSAGPGFYINPDYIKLDGLFDNFEDGPSLIATSLGRFRTSDFSTKIFSQKIDGFVMNFNYPVLELTIAAGYTGLFFSKTGSLLSSSPSTIMSKTDAFERANSTGLFESPETPGDNRYLFQSPRAVEIITLTLPQIAAKQSLTLSFAAQEDMRPMMDIIGAYAGESYTPVLLQEGETEYSPDKGGAVDTQYLGLGVSGPSIDSLYHNVYYYFGTGRAMSYQADSASDTGSSYGYDTIFAHLVGFNVDYYLSGFFNSRAGLGFTLGTGDSDANSFYEGNTEGSYTQFLPITGGGGGMIFSPGVSNIISGSANFSMKPFSDMDIPFVKNAQLVLNAMPFFRTTTGPIAISGIDPNFTGNYLGSEIDFTMNLRPFSDLGVITQLGYFLPNSTAFAGSSTADPVFMAKLNVSLSF